MECAELGSLRSNLFEVGLMEWKNKLNLLNCLASDLQIIHSRELIHRDLHSGNVLQNHLESAYIADLGLAISTNIDSKIESDKVYGILPYIAPEALMGNPYTTASDIYSFGIIMWEILYGMPINAFYSEVFRSQLQMQIMLNEIRPPIFEEWFDELRPPILENAETCYVSLMTQCWDSKPDKRPSAAKLVETFTQWQNNEQIVSNLSEFDKEFRILIHVQSEENEEFIYSSENHSDIDDLINEYNTKSTSTDKFLNIDDLIIEYNNKPTSSEKLLILFNTKEMSPAKNSDIPDTLE